MFTFYVYILLSIVRGQDTRDLKWTSSVLSTYIQSLKRLFTGKSTLFCIRSIKSVVQQISLLDFSGKESFSKQLLHSRSCVRIAKGPITPILSCKKYSTDWQMFLAIVCHMFLCSRDHSRLSVTAVDDSTSVSLSHVYLSRKWVPIMPAHMW